MKLIYVYLTLLSAIILKGLILSFNVEMVGVLFLLTLLIACSSAIEYFRFNLKVKDSQNDKKLLEDTYKKINNDKIKELEDKIEDLNRKVGNLGMAKVYSR